MIILWIDPWTTTTWFCLIKEENSEAEILDYWILKTLPKTDLSIKIFEIWNDIKNLIEKYDVKVIVIEKLYFQKNTKTAIDVAQARWVVLYEAIKHNLKIMEFTPLQVKKAITWNGKANKKQLENAIKILFWLENIPKYDDASDAIWMAYMWFLNKNSLQ